MYEWKNFSIYKSLYIKEDQELLDFQQYSVYQSLIKKSFVFSLPTGAGKTFASLSSYFYYVEKYPKTKLIIVTNKSALFQFNSEIDKFFNFDKKRLIIHSDLPGKYKEVRAKAYSDFLESDTSVIIMNYPVLKIDIDKIIASIESLKKDSENKLFLILDEASAFKNTNTATYKAVLQMSGFMDKIIALTATLISGKLEEAYGIFRAIKIPLTKNKKAFIETFCITRKIPHLKIQQIVGYKNIINFKKLINPHCILLNKSDISESLPSFTSTISYLEEDWLQKETLKKIKDGYFTIDIDNNDAEKLVKMAEFGYTRRCHIDPNILFPDEKKISNYFSPKTLEILNVLNNELSDEKVIIYSHSKQYIKILEQAILSKCYNKQYKNILRITGDVTGEQREKNKQLFLDSEKYNLILLNKAGIEAINLQSASILIVVDLPQTGGSLIQLLGRLSRIGSKHSNLYVKYLLMKSSQDESEYFIIQKQLLLLNKVLGESEKNIIDFNYLRKDITFKNMSDEDFSCNSLNTILYNKYKKDTK